MDEDILIPELSTEKIGADVSIRGYIDDSLSPQEAPTKDYPRGSQRNKKRRAKQPILLSAPTYIASPADLYCFA